jgi:hypothetical protein
MIGLRARLSGLIIAGIFLAITGAHIGWHLLSFSDGARLEPGESSWTSEGVRVTPLIEMSNGLRRGDLVVAVDGRSMEFWARALFERGIARPMWTGSTLPTYTVLRDGQRIDLVVPPTPYPLGAILAKNWSTILLVIFSQIIITLVFLVKPYDRAPQVLFLWVWSFSHTYVWSMGLTVPDIVNGVGYWLHQLGETGMWLIFWSALLEFAMVLMREHPLFRQYRWVRPAIYLSAFVMYFGYLAILRFVSPNPLHWVGRTIIGNWLVALVMQLATIYFIIREYRAVREPAARRKVRWLVFAFFLSGSVGLIFWFIPGIVLGQPFIDAHALGLALMPFPVIVAIAVLRDQLFDIDVIIRRTLIYSTLTAVLALFYFATVVLSQQIFRWLTGAGDDLAIIVSTLTIAALFNPMRYRVQNIIDQRFYRRKYNAQQVLAQFAATVRDEVELEKLAGELLRVVDETMQPTHVSLWLRKTDDRRRRTEENPSSSVIHPPSQGVENA